jgi:hypothetical protein
MQQISNPGNPNVLVLKNGDSVPGIKPFGKQEEIQYFVRNYVDATTKKVKLDSNQAIFLFELYTTNLKADTADFQDLVVLVSLSEGSGGGQGSGNPTYTISASAGSNGSISPAGNSSVAPGGSKTFTISPSSGYAIQDVSVDGSSVGAVGSYTFSDVSGNHSIAVTFKSVTYTITASAGSKGSISPCGAQTVQGGGSKTFTMSPSWGYKVDNVTVDGASVGAVTTYTFSNVTANHTISATFKKKW